MYDTYILTYFKQSVTLIHRHKFITMTSTLTSDRSVKFDDKFVKSSEQGHFVLALNANKTLRKTVYSTMTHIVLLCITQQLTSNILTHK